MGGCLCDEVRNRFLDAVFGGVAWDPPRVLHAGLSMSPANPSGAVWEPNAASYARVAVPNDLDHFPPAERGQKWSSATIRFPAPADDWGCIQAVFVADAAEGGRVLAMADLVAPLWVSAGGPALRIAPGGLSLISL